MMNRKSRRSDRICPNFLESDGICQWQNRCFSAHLRSIDIYASLLQSKVRYVYSPTWMTLLHGIPIDPKTLMADGQPVDELPKVTDCKASVAPLTPVDDQQPVAELPEMTDCIAREPSFADNISPHPANVQLPSAPFLDREHTLSESGVLEPPQSPVVDAVSLPTVRLPKPAKPQQASTAELLVTVRFFFPAIKHDHYLCRHRNGKEKNAWDLSGTRCHRIYLRTALHPRTPTLP
jgi:hypothetical protein